jgi:hypothetical protein
MPEMADKLAVVLLLLLMRQLESTNQRQLGCLLHLQLLPVPHKLLLHLRARLSKPATQNQTSSSAPNVTMHYATYPHPETQGGPEQTTWHAMCGRCISLPNCQAGDTRHHIPAGLLALA